MRAWVLTDGAPENETPCLGVAEAVADRIERRRIAPRAPWRWLTPFGPIDPRHAPEGGTGPIATSYGLSWPDVAIAAGSTAAPYLRRLRRASGGRTLTVFLGPAAGLGIADVVWSLDQRRLRGPNAIATLTWPTRLNAVRLAAARGGSPVASPTPGGPRVCVLVGGARRWPEDDLERFVAGLRRLRTGGAVLLAAPAARTPQDLVIAIREAAHYVWHGKGLDPTVALIAQSDAVVAVADQASVSEAATTGRPVFVFRPAGLARADRAFLDRLTALGVVRPFAGRIDRYAYAPLDSTAEVARAIHALSATRAVLQRGPRSSPATRMRETNGPNPR